MRLIHRVYEGQHTYPGINWHRDRMSRIRVVIRIGRTSIYFRWRSKYAGGKRFIYEVYHAPRLQEPPVSDPGEGR